MSWPPNRLSPGANPNPALSLAVVAIVDYDLHNHGRVREVVTFESERIARIWLDGYWSCGPARASAWLCGPEPVRLKGGYSALANLTKEAEDLRGTAWSDYRANDATTADRILAADSVIANLRAENAHLRYALGVE